VKYHRATHGATGTEGRDTLKQNCGSPYYHRATPALRSERAHEAANPPSAPPIIRIVTACRTPLDRDERAHHETTVKALHCTTPTRGDHKAYPAAPAVLQGKRELLTLSHPSSPNAPYQLGTRPGGLTQRSCIGPAHKPACQAGEEATVSISPRSRLSSGAISKPNVSVEGDTLQGSHTEPALWSLSI